MVKCAVRPLRFTFSNLLPNRTKIKEQNLMGQNTAAPEQGPEQAKGTFFYC